MSNVPNPWASDDWNLTEQGAYIKKYGVEVAKRKARQAGSALGALKPRTPPVLPPYLVIVQHKGLMAPVGGGGLIGAGSSGSGDPT